VYPGAGRLPLRARLHDLFIRHTVEADLVGIHAPGPCIDLEYDVRRKRGRSTEGLLGGLQIRIDDDRTGVGW
jgi:hypothetical protein